MAATCKITGSEICNECGAYEVPANAHPGRKPLANELPRTCGACAPGKHKFLCGTCAPTKAAGWVGERNWPETDPEAAAAAIVAAGREMSAAFAASQAASASAAAALPISGINCAECDTRVPTPVNENYLMLGGTPAVIKFLCGACSPTKGHQFVSMGESKWAARVAAAAAAAPLPTGPGPGPHSCEECGTRAMPANKHSSEETCPGLGGPSVEKFLCGACSILPSKRPAWVSMGESKWAERAAAKVQPDVVMWVTTMKRGHRKWVMAEDEDWRAAFRQFAAHEDYAMVTDKDARKVFRNPNGGKFNKYIYTVEKETKAMFTAGDWILTLCKVKHPAAEMAFASLMPPQKRSGTCQLPAPTCSTCGKYGQPETGAAPWVQGSVFMCATCSPSMLASYVMQGSGKDEDDHDALRASRVTARTAYDEAYEALMREGRVKEDFTDKMTGLANDFVKAAVAKEKADANFALFMGTDVYTDTGKKRRRN